MHQTIDETINKLLDQLKPVQRQVIIGRFGLKANKRLTLQKIGDNLGITRERVRQIENSLIKKLSSLAEKEGKHILTLSHDYLSRVGGIRENDIFLNELFYHLQEKGDFLPQKIKFLFLVAGRPFYYEEDDYFHDFWYINESVKESFLSLASEVINLFEKHDKSKFLEHRIHLRYFKDFKTAHILTVLKNVETNVFGDIGLASWPEINPKTIRDKIYIVLSKKGTAMHFTEIARAIDQLRLTKKKTHIQTVHNELIKDKRFVLVGRGIYALKELGYQGGTAAETIINILKAASPLTASEIINLVSQKKFFKPQTILANLQNRQYFEKLPDGRYHLK